MPKFAVAFYSQWDNVLKIDLIEAPTWQEAATQHKFTCWGEVSQVPVKLEDARAEAFEFECGFDCIEIPS